MRKIAYIIKIITFFGLYSLLSPQTVLAFDNIEITDVRVPPVPPVSQMAAIYFTLHNKSDRDLVFVNVSSSVARHVMLHLSQEVDGVAKMSHVDTLVISAKSQLELAPGGYHVMLMGRDKALMSKPYELILEFEHHPSKIITISPPVKE